MHILIYNYKTNAHTILTDYVAVFKCPLSTSFAYTCWHVKQWK